MTAVNWMSRPVTRISLCLVAVLLAIVPFAPSMASAPVQRASFDPAKVFTYVGAWKGDPSRPRQIVLTLHGMGGEGKGFCQSYLRAADESGWILVAPTFSYGNWRDPAVVGGDDVALTRALIGFVDGFAQKQGLPTNPEIAIIGFSRGAQLAHRLALAYPERTSAIAAASAGTYTLPTETDRVSGSTDSALRFPFGLAGLGGQIGRRVDPARLGSVNFWIAVGEKDDRPDDVPRQWDSYLGRTRLQRARSFVSAVKDAGGNAELRVFPGVDHAMAPPMVSGAIGFVQRMTSPRAHIGPAGGRALHVS